MLVWHLKSIDVVMMVNHNQPKMQKNITLQNPYTRMEQLSTKFCLKIPNDPHIFPITDP
jgi:hypothetical protein